MMGVFLIPAFTGLGHESQDLVNACVHRLDFGSHFQRVLGECSQNLC